MFFGGWCGSFSEILLRSFERYCYLYGLITHAGVCCEEPPLVNQTRARVLGYARYHNSVFSARASFEPLLQSPGPSSSLAPKKKKSVVIKKRSTSEDFVLDLVISDSGAKDLEHNFIVSAKDEEHGSTSDPIVPTLPELEVAPQSEEVVSTPSRKRGRDRGMTPSPEKFKTILG
ncbi:hypothetical protein ACLB2K_011398 [Fragaria x ananassa]